MNKQGFTFIEILIGLSVSVAIFVITTTLVVNVFTSSVKGKQVETLAQVKNDLQAEFGNTVRWADDISYAGGVFQVDAMSYSLRGGRLYKNDSPLTPQGVEITKFEVSKYGTQGAGGAAGSGIVAQYFNNPDMTELVFTQTDFTVDFDWGAGSPDELVKADHFSARFIGQINAETTGEYTFYVVSDDGARLWVNDMLIVDDWGVPGFSESTGKINLSAGKYNIRLDYYEDSGPAEVSLAWSYSGRPREIIPTESLFPTSGPTSLAIVVDMKLGGSLMDSLKVTLSPRSAISTIE
jgi:hypothetical protein